LKGGAKALTFSPSIISYAGSRAQIAWRRERPSVNFVLECGGELPFFRRGWGRFFLRSVLPRLTAAKGLLPFS